MKIGIIKPSMYIKLTRLTLTGKNGDNEYFLTWSYKNRYYTITVSDSKTNKNISNLRVVMNETILRTLVKFMEKVKSKDEEVEYSLTSKSIDFDNRDKDTLLIRGKILVGKKKVNNDYINYITLTNSDNSVKITFPLIPNKYYVFGKDGNEINKTTELSNIYLESYIEIIKDLIAILPKFTEADMFDTDNGDNKYKRQNKTNTKNNSNDDIDDLF